MERGGTAAPWLGERRSLFDALGVEWTLLRAGPAPPAGDRLIAAAARLGVDLHVVDVASGEVLELYEEPLVLIRPDQVVAWRGSADGAAEAVLATVTGRPRAPGELDRRAGRPIARGERR